MASVTVPSQYLLLKRGELHGKCHSTKAANASEVRSAYLPYRLGGTAYREQCQGASRLQVAGASKGTGNAPRLQIISYLSTIVQLSHPTCM